jgi:hypothetical protein
MSADDLRAMVTATPFVPFRLYMTNGRKLDVHHPDYVRFEKRVRTAVVFECDDPADVYTYSNLVQIAIIHITRTEPLETASPR